MSNPSIPSLPRLVLGSASPRRCDLLLQVGVTPDVIAGADIDETPRKNELPRTYVLRMALEKNAALAPQFPQDFILTADTSVIVGRRIIGKAASDDEQKEFMRLFSGRAHRVLTAVALRAPDGRVASRLSVTQVKMKRLSEAEIDAYVATKTWEGKAGYMFHSLMEAAVRSINGSPSGILGLPLFETMNLLKGFGYADQA